MASKRYHKHSGRKHGGRRHKRGGAGAANPSSYSDSQSYMKATVGSGNEQYDNVFSSARSHNSNSGAIVGLQGQKAGSRRNRSRRGGSRKRRGGLWGQIVSQAMVPFSILGMQQTYRRKSRGGRGRKSARRH